MSDDDLIEAILEVYSKQKVKPLKDSTIKTYSFKQLANHIQNYTEYHTQCGYRTMWLNGTLQVLQEHGDMYLFYTNCTNKQDLVDLIVNEIY